VSRIRLLSEQVASQVAAGEVVERPASVVKELVENSLDAEARRIEVRIQRGGSSLIRVIDDGIGMERDDALLCLERHATSKIRTGADLASIRTLGFRGEAIPSIASVSKFRLTTREREALVGTEILINGGRIGTVRDAGEPAGTQIEVRQLFYNLPARRKFLRTENTESSHVEQQIMLQALGHPEVAFVLVRDDRVVWQLPATERRIDRIRDLVGQELAAELIEVESSGMGGIEITGFLGKPGISRSTRAQQITFVNGRAVENPILSAALREGYHTALMKGQYPVTFLFLEMDPASVDVNVHPAKREVRFRDGITLRESVIDAVRRTIETTRTSWQSTFHAPARTAEVDLPRLQPDVPRVPEPEPRDLPGVSVKPATALGPLVAPARGPVAAPVPFQPPQSEPAVPAVPERSTPPQFRIIGVLGKLSVLMENESGLVLVDQHAAHERILFEELRRRLEAHGAPSQRLLMPITIDVTPRDAAWLERNTDTLQRMGIGIEPFGHGTFKVDALPAFVKEGEPAQWIRDVIDELREAGAAASTFRLGEDIIAKTVCRHAVKANDVLREPELVQLIHDLLACDLPYCCPHGRPTMIQMSYGELERKFGRRV